MRRTTHCKAFVLAVAATLLAGCGHVIPAELTGTGTQFDFAKHQCRPNAEADAQKVEVRTLGSGGALIRWRGESLLLGPSYSNPGLLRAFAWRGRADDALIDASLHGAGNVTAILAGHSHYDHIGDLPAVAKRFPKAKIYLNKSGVNIVTGEHLNVQEIRIGEPIPVSSAFRVKAIENGHAPQLCRWNRFPCTYATRGVEQVRLARMSRQRLRTMRGGDVLAFDIELLGERGETRFRIYYNDAAASSPLGQSTGPLPRDPHRRAMAMGARLSARPAADIAAAPRARVALGLFLPPHHGHLEVRPLAARRRLSARDKRGRPRRGRDTGQSRLRRHHETLHDGRSRVIAALQAEVMR